jgi:hypothetical protein
MFQNRKPDGPVFLDLPNLIINNRHPDVQAPKPDGPVFPDLPNLIINNRHPNVRALNWWPRSLLQALPPNAQTTRVPFHRPTPPATNCPQLRLVELPTGELLLPAQPTGAIDIWSRVGIVPTISENLQTETSSRVGSALMTTARKRMKEAFEVTCETTRIEVDDNQDSRSALGRSNGHTIRLKLQW